MEASSSRHSPSLPSLPGELLAAVASLLDDPTDRARLELACRAAAAAVRRPGLQELSVEHVFTPLAPIYAVPYLAAFKAKGLSMDAHLPAIVRHTTLTRLELPDCGLASLPPECSNLRTLRHLDPSGNEHLMEGWLHLGTLPALTHLASSASAAAAVLHHHLQAGSNAWGLRSLALAYQSFEGLPDEEEEEEAPLPNDVLGRFPGLTHLALSFCAVGSLPAELGSLDTLRSLSVEDCNLSGWESLPCQLTRLCLLACNPFPHLLPWLPTQLSLLTSLQSLDLRVQSWLPVSSLTGLTRLEIVACDLEALPTELAALTALRELDVSWNNGLVGGLSHLAACSQLTHLDVSECYEVATRELGALPALRVLNLKEVDLKGAGRVAALSALTQLETLDLTETDAAEALPVVAALPCLSSLHLEYAIAADGWQHLARMRGLASLDLSGCGLARIPQELSSLSALQRLCTDYNVGMQHGWEHLLPLSGQAYLSLKGCDLQRLPPELEPLHEHVRIRF
ncbi:hypothetical protein ABPG75_012877 [Micractinium tetrahymenae]